MWLLNICILLSRISTYIFFFCTSKLCLYFASGVCLPTCQGFLFGTCFSFFLVKTLFAVGFLQPLVQRAGFF